MFKVIFVACLVYFVSAVLQVYSPACSATRLPGNIEYTLSNFGEIPYGETIIGQIILPKDPELCKIAGETYLSNQDSTTKNILLVKRGTCKFTQKVINAQNLGADLIIIYDNVEGTSPTVMMKNDGHGHLAEIPSLFISSADGKKLMATSSECPKLPVMRIKFQIDQASTSDVTLWLDVGNRQTFILARDFYKNKYYEAIQDRINLQIRFRVENTCEDWICSKDDCVGILLEKYCRSVEKPKTPDMPFTKGADLIEQQLREYFLWEGLKKTSDKEVWWRYMTKFDHNVCIEQKDVEDCSYSTMKEIGLSGSIIDQVKEGVKQTKEKITQRKNNILRLSYEQSREMGIYFYPEATINNRNFYGLFKAPQVFEAICNSLIDPPSECIKFIKQNHEINTKDEGEGMWKTVLLILLLMTVGFVVALLVYTKLIKKEVNQQLSVQVNKMVEKYVTMVGKKGDSSANSYNKFDS